METLKEYLENWDKPLFENKQKLRERTLKKTEERYNIANDVAERVKNDLEQDEVNQKLQALGNKKEVYDVHNKIWKAKYNIIPYFIKSEYANNIDIVSGIERSLYFLDLFIANIYNAFGPPDSAKEDFLKFKKLREQYRKYFKFDAILNRGIEKILENILSFKEKHKPYFNDLHQLAMKNEERYAVRNKLYDRRENLKNAYKQPEKLSNISLKELMEKLRKKQHQNR